MRALTVYPKHVALSAFISDFNSSFKSFKESVWNETCWNEFILPPIKYKRHHLKILGLLMIWPQGSPW